MLKRFLIACAALALGGCPKPASEKTCDEDPTQAKCQQQQTCTAACCPENGQVCDLTPAAAGITPFDATLSPDGKTAYAIGIGANGPAVFKNAAPSAAAPAVLAEGDPLAGPTSIDITSNGGTLVVADPAAILGDDDHGAVFTLPATGGTLSVLSGTQGYRPRGLVVVAGNGGDDVYFTGYDPADSAPGLFKISAAGGTAAVVAKGGVFVDPSGVAITAAGSAYVLDTQNPSGDSARLLKIANGAATVALGNLRVGYPAGIALSSDDKTLLISGLDAAKGTDVVLRFDTATNQVAESISNGIDTFSESAGLHRAKGVNAYAWADSKANGGTVFVVNKQ